MSDEKSPRPGGRRRADVPEDSPSTVEITAVPKRALEPAEPAELAEASEVLDAIEDAVQPPTRPESEVEPEPVEPEPAPAPAPDEPEPDEPETAPAPEPDAHAPADRRRRARLNPVLLLGVLLPLLTVGALLLVQSPEESVSSQPPTRSPLTRVWLVCPGTGDARTWAATADPEATGEVQGTKPVEVSNGAVVPVKGSVLVGRDATAPGLTAVQSAPGRAAACTPPEFDHWFTGLGAGAEHRSTLRLVNPDAGTAVADITVYGRSGVLGNADDLRGISVSGRDTLTLPLAERIPTDEELTVHVSVQRGRLGVSAEDTFTPVGSKKAVSAWAQTQAGPADETRLLGVGAGAGTRTLTLANPGQDSARVQLQVISDDSEFTPAGLDDVSVAAGQVRTVDLTKVLEDTASVRGLLVRSTEPVASSLRSVTAGELVWAAPSVPIGGTSKAPVSAGLTLPPGAKRLVLAGARPTGELTVTLRAGDGKELAPLTVEVAPGRSATLEVPDKARWVGIESSIAGVGAVVELRGEGASANHAVLPVRPLVNDDLKPAVRQALS